MELAALAAAGWVNFDAPGADNAIRSVLFAPVWSKNRRKDDLEAVA